MAIELGLTVNGNREIVICDSARFAHLDADEGRRAFSFWGYNDWIILERLCDVILYFRPHCIVEIGAGESTFYLARAAKRLEVKLYTCDIKPAKNIKLFKDHEFFQETSYEFMKHFDDTPGIVLIDADHRYEPAKMEFDFFFDKLIPGGVIFIHDTMPPCKEILTDNGCGDVYKLRQELEHREDLDCFTWPYTAGFNGLTMVLKKEKDRPYWEQ